MPKSRHRRAKAGKVAAPHGIIPADMKRAIDEFYAQSEGLVTAFGQRLEAEPPPPMIYHYTTDAGLRGIIESGKLWLTDVFNQNDPSELRHGLSPAIEMLAESVDEKRGEIKLFGENIAAMLRGGVEDVAHFYVCCFSKAQDDLGQWRAYAGNGRGYAIGFDARMLEKAFGNERRGNMAFPVTYDEDELREMHRRMVSGALSLVAMPRRLMAPPYGRALRNQTINAFMSEVSISLCVPILRAALFFKHQAYRNEQEYRFLQIYAKGQDVPGLKHRGRADGQVKYREFDWRTVVPDAIKCVISGPAADKVPAARFAESCLREFHRGAGAVPITHSTVPYRA
jgi:hypothetical protein